MLWYNNNITACKCHMNCARREVITNTLTAQCSAVCSVRLFQSLHKPMQIFCVRARGAERYRSHFQATAPFGSLLVLICFAQCSCNWNCAKTCATNWNWVFFVFLIGLFSSSNFPSLSFVLRLYRFGFTFLFYIWQWFTVFGAEFLIRYRLEHKHRKRSKSSFYTKNKYTHKLTCTHKSGTK